MVARFRAIAVVGVGLAILLTITAAPAAPQANNPYNLRGPRNIANDYLRERSRDAV